jgi:hypothetical protein
VVRADEQAYRVGQFILATVFGIDKSAAGARKTASS